jgi:hypothetical protein
MRLQVRVFLLGSCAGDNCGWDWGPPLLEARPAEHGTALRGFKRNGCFGGALRTNCPGFRAHAAAGSSHALDFALFAPLWIVLELLIVKEQLFAGGKDKVVTTIRTFQYLIDEVHTRPPEHALEFSSIPSTDRWFGNFSPASLIHQLFDNFLPFLRAGNERGNGTLPYLFFANS